MKAIPTEYSNLEKLIDKKNDNKKNIKQQEESVTFLQRFSLRLGILESGDSNFARRKYQKYCCLDTF